MVTTVSVFLMIRIIEYTDMSQAQTNQLS